MSTTAIMAVTTVVITVFPFSPDTKIRDVKNTWPAPLQMRGISACLSRSVKSESLAQSADHLAALY